VVDVGAFGDHVHALGLAAGGDAVGGVVAVAVAGGDVHAVDLVPAGRHRQRGGVGALVGGRVGGAPGGDGAVGVVGGVVGDAHDGAVRAGAEGVVRGRVGVAAGAEHADVRRRPVGPAFDLVQRAVVGAEQGTGGAVGGNAGRAAAGVDVTGQRAGGLGRA